MVGVKLVLQCYFDAWCRNNSNMTFCLKLRPLHFQMQTNTCFTRTNTHLTPTYYHLVVLILKGNISLYMVMSRQWGHLADYSCCTSFTCDLFQLSSALVLQINTNASFIKGYYGKDIWLYSKVNEDSNCTVLNIYSEYCQIEKLRLNSSEVRITTSCFVCFKTFCQD